MGFRIIAVGTFALLLGALPSSGQTFTEGFDGGSNEGGWTWGPPESIPPTGGNPGAYLYVPVVDTFAPQPRTSLGISSEFTGDYLASGVSSIGVDLITFDVDFSAAGRPLTLMLLNDNGTPGNSADDWGAYDIGPANVPLVGQGWLSYDFSVPSSSAGLPSGWLFWQLPAGKSWSDLITDVDRVLFFYGDPDLVFIFQQWELGLDNPRIAKETTGGPGVARPDMVMDRISPTQVKLIWTGSDCRQAQDYGIFGGTIGDWYSHSRIDCSDTDADLEETVLAGAGDRYYLVVPLDGAREGSYGTDSSGGERPKAAAGACKPSHFPGCG